MLIRLCSFATLAVASCAHAQTVTWVDLTHGQGGRPSTVTGVFDLAPAGPGAEDVGFTYTGEVYFVQLAPTGNYWAPSDAYLSASITNAPSSSDIITMAGGAPLLTQTVTFSKPVREPLMALLSVGSPSRPITYEFSTHFEVMSYGRGYWGSGPLTELAGNVLEGREGHGVIRFPGVHTQISWTVPTYESWHGFTFGLFANATCGADFNFDGFVDFFDYDDYVNCFETNTCPEGRSPDFNGDGFGDFFDYDAFVTAFESGC